MSKPFKILPILPKSIKNVRLQTQKDMSRFGKQQKKISNKLQVFHNVDKQVLNRTFRATWLAMHRLTTIQRQPGTSVCRIQFDDSLMMILGTRVEWLPH